MTAQQPQSAPDKQDQSQQAAEQNCQVAGRFPGPEHQEHETSSDQEKPVSFRGSGYSSDEHEPTDETVTGEPGTGEIVTPRPVGPPTRP
ncbi:hypothetical protein [Pedobacter yulinensis]|nr:hypothetical protein [Pedobacter yulinensis]